MAIIEQELLEAQTEQPALIITSDASGHLLRLMQEKELNTEDYALRVFVAGGGCSGLQYGMTFDDEMQEGDHAFEANGLRVLVDQVSHRYLVGSTVDYVDSLMGGGFKIDNPNSAGGCGCGKSFRSEEEQEGAAEEAAAGNGCGSCGGH